jgi:hypothetical protein
MMKVHNEIKVSKGKVVKYIDTTFDYIVPEHVSITLEKCERSIISECGVGPLRATP